LALGTFATLCLFLNSSYSLSSLNNGAKGFVVLSLEIFKFSIFCSNSFAVIKFVSKESSAAPFATKRCASSGTIISSGFKFL